MALAVLLLPELSYSQSDPTVSSQLCIVREMFCGVVGSVIATISLVVVGATSFTGKLPWTFALIFTAALLFFMNANTFATMITSEPVECACN